MLNMSSFLESVLAEPLIELPRLEIIARGILWQCNNGEHQYLLTKDHNYRWSVPGGYINPQNTLENSWENGWLAIQNELRALIKRQLRVGVQEIVFLRDFTFWRGRDETKILGFHFGAEIEKGAIPKYDQSYLKAEWANIGRASGRQYYGNLFQDIKDLDFDLRTGRTARRKIRDMENY